MDVYKTINGIVTHLIVWGDVFGADDSDVVVCVLGCPGIPMFYKEFGAEIHERTQLPVCLVGHAGHDIIPKELRNKDECDKNAYDIHEQINHKLIFFNNYIKNTKRIHLIGHSFGAWLLLEMLDKNENLIKNVASIHLLFPTLQELDGTPMGRWVKLIRKLHCLAILLLIMLELIPKSMKSVIIRVLLQLWSLPSHYVERMMLYIKPEIKDRALKLAYELMDKSTKLNTIAMDKIKHITHVIYSPQDHWTLPKHIEALKIFQPELQISELNVYHAFVLKSSSEVGKYVADHLRKKKINTKLRSHSR